TPQTSAGYPSISVHTTSVNSLQRQGGELHRLLLTPQINQGHTGGPALDGSGQVVGVLAGLQGSGSLNQAIPVSHVRRFLARPDLQFPPPVLPAANQHQPVVFQVRAVALVPSPGPLSLELRLRAGDQAQRTHKMVRVGDSHRATAVAVPAPTGSLPLRLGGRFGRDSLGGVAACLPFTVGGRRLKLSEVRTLQPQSKPRAVLQGGKTVQETISGLEAVEVQLGEDMVRLNLMQATKVQIEVPAAVDTVAYTVVATQDSQ